MILIRSMVLLSLLLFTACETVTEPALDAVETDSKTAEKVELVDNRYWVQVTDSDDPWDAMKSEEAESCTDLDLDTEELSDGVWFDITTKVCAYVTVHQTLQHDVPKGALMTLRIWHFKMSSWEGTFHLAYQIGFDEAPEWELDKEVPSESGLIYEQWEASRDFKQGDDIYFHLSNHGENTWSLIELSATY